jgi:hypothetical protein
MSRVQQTGDVGVGERRENAPFLDETLVELGKLQVRAQEFDGDRLIDFAIDAVGEPDSSHATLAEQPAELEGSAALPGVGGLLFGCGLDATGEEGIGVRFKGKERLDFSAGVGRDFVEQVESLSFRGRREVGDGVEERAGGDVP